MRPSAPTRRSSDLGRDAGVAEHVRRSRQQRRRSGDEAGRELDDEHGGVEGKDDDEHAALLGLARQPLQIARLACAAVVQRISPSRSSGQEQRNARVRAVGPGHCPELEFSMLRKLMLAGLAATTLITAARSEEHTSELQSLMRNSYAVFSLYKTTHTQL